MYTNKKEKKHQKYYNTEKVPTVNDNGTLERTAYM